MPRTHIGQPFLCHGFAEITQGMHFDHDAELEIFADETDLGIDDPYAGPRLDFDKPELLEQHQRFAQR
ncbi:hypothetical protein D3C87_2116930 [compost metagenome]